ncbi:hypothetical protein [Litchfieldia alkalitelluris]|uniref:hypothetical protein n=1 Tax=Litchfieldia alkalitelluris TaxID=304268 RepID=UPI000996E9C3|nr:hypothetical protein [Litchfieldia alkalitelluris]
MEKGKGEVSNQIDKKADEPLEQSGTQEQSERNENTETVDPFTRLMFGGKRPRSFEDVTKTEEVSKSTTDDQNMDFTQYYTLMEQVDDILGSYNRIKPVIKELSPLLNFIKKWK